MDILFDVDGTIADVHHLWAERLSATYERQLRERGAYPFTFEDISDWSFGPKAAMLGLSPQDCTDMIFQLWKERWREVPTVDEGVSRAMQELAAFDIVTSDAQGQEIQQWLGEQRIPYRAFRQGGSSLKLTYDILVEDNPALAARIREGQHLLLRDRPWNRDIPDCAHVRRFHGSEELPDLIERIMRNP